MKKTVLALVVTLTLAGCGKKAWHVTGSFHVRGTCVAAASPDETEGRMICRKPGGLLECWTNAPDRFHYPTFDDGCRAAREAIEDARQLP